MPLYDFRIGGALFDQLSLHAKAQLDKTSKRLMSEGKLVVMLGPLHNNSIPLDSLVGIIKEIRLRDDDNLWALLNYYDTVSGYVGRIYVMENCPVILTPVGIGRYGEGQIIEDFKLIAFTFRPSNEV